MFQNEKGLEVSPLVEANGEAPGLPLEDEVAVDRRLQALNVLLETRDDFVVRGGEKIGVLLDVAQGLQFRVVEAAALVREGVERRSRSRCISGKFLTLSAMWFEQRMPWQ